MAITDRVIATMSDPVAASATLVGEPFTVYTAQNPESRYDAVARLVRRMFCS